MESSRGREEEGTMVCASLALELSPGDKSWGIRAEFWPFRLEGPLTPIVRSCCFPFVAFPSSFFASTASFRSRRFRALSKSDRDTKTALLICHRSDLLFLGAEAILRTVSSAIVAACNMCTCSGNGTQERAVQDLLCLVDLYLVYLI